MDVRSIINRAKEYISCNCSDELMKEIVEEGFKIATRGLDPADVSDIYCDDMLRHYLVAQLGLLNGDFSIYNCYTAMFNTALSEFRGAAAENSMHLKNQLCFKNIF